MLRLQLAASVATALFGAIIVIDGDTVKMDGTRYRLLGFDTPETYWSRCNAEWVAGKAATARLKELLGTSEVGFAPTGKSCKWRRECARLYFNGEDVADIMVREGHAVRYTGRGLRKNWCAEVS